jgi:hypothetical protein
LIFVGGASYAAEWVRPTAKWGVEVPCEDVGTGRPRSRGDSQVGLLENALRVSGGLDLWRLRRRFTLHLSITGALCAAKCSTAQLRELVVEGSTRRQALVITGFPSADLRALYRSEWVALEGPDGRRLVRHQGAPGEFRGGLQATTWDELQLTHYCGYLIWNHIVTPFILADPDFETKELRRSRESGDGMRRLRVEFPARVVTHAAAQTFWFDREGLLRRLDYPAAHADRTQIAQMLSGHQRFSGILVPTLCRLLTVGADGVPIAKPPLLDIEIFDAKFE